jgi:hypothetical protein
MTVVAVCAYLLAVVAIAFPRETRGRSMRAPRSWPMLRQAQHDRLGRGVPGSAERWKLQQSGRYRAIPREAELLCVDPDNRLRPNRLDVFAVADDFYTVNPYMARPTGIAPLFTTQFTADPLDAAV